MFTAQDWPIACNMLSFGSEAPDGTPIEDAPASVWAWQMRQVRELGFDFIDPTNLPEKLASALQDIYSRCVKKFAAYPDARRVLVLDPHADLRYLGTDWWKGVFSVLPPPTEIDEIWSEAFELVEEGLEGWIFEQLR